MRTNDPTVRTRSIHFASEHPELQAVQPRSAAGKAARMPGGLFGRLPRRLTLLLTAFLAMALVAGCTDTPAADDNAGLSPSGDQSAGASASDEALPTDDGADCNDQLAAIVNGQEIPLADFQTQAFDTQRYFVEQGLDPNSEDGQQQLLALRRQVLDDMINQALIEQYAVAESIDVSESDLDARMQVYLDEAGGEEAFAADLSAAGTSRDALRAMERKSLIGQRVLDQIAGDVPTVAEHRNARHILCETEEDCREALERIQGGEDFAEVAKSVSKDVTTAESGGDLDWLARGMVPSPELDEMIFSLPEGQTSDVVMSSFGYHVIEVLEVDPERALTEQQQYALREKSLLDWLAERRAGSNIHTCIPDAVEVGD